MKTPLGMEVELGSGLIVLDGVPALRERGTAAPPVFSAQVYCGHGRPSQLLLSSYYHLLYIGLDAKIRRENGVSPKHLATHTISAVVYREIMFVGVQSNHANCNDVDCHHA